MAAKAVRAGGFFMCFCVNLPDDKNISKRASCKLWFKMCKLHKKIKLNMYICIPCIQKYALILGGGYCIIRLALEYFVLVICMRCTRTSVSKIF